MDQVFENVMKFLNIEVDTRNFDFEADNLIKESLHKLEINPKKRKTSKRKIVDSE